MLTLFQVPISQYGLRGIAMLLKYDVESANTLDKRLVISVKNVSVFIVLYICQVLSFFLNLELLIGCVSECAHGFCSNKVNYLFAEN